MGNITDAIASVSLCRQCHSCDGHEVGRASYTRIRGHVGESGANEVGTGQRWMYKIVKQARQGGDWAAVALLCHVLEYG